MGGPLSGPIRQVGFVVRDLDRSIAEWLAMGVGPWYVVRNRVQQAYYRGNPCEVTMSIALANSGDLQLELIQQHDDAPSIFTEFLEMHGEGFHQFAWWVADFDARRGRGGVIGLAGRVERRRGHGDPLRLRRTAVGQPGDDLRAHGTH